MLAVLNRLIDKFSSGRFLTTVALIYTYCFIVGYTTRRYVESLIQNPERLESFAVGLIVGFSGMATLVIKSYFDNVERKPKERP